MIFFASRAVNLLVTKGLGSEPSRLTEKGQILKSAWVATLAIIAGQKWQLYASHIPAFAGDLREKSGEEVWQIANRPFGKLTVVAHILVALGLVLSSQLTPCSFPTGIVC
jgi:hypothetical protein